MFYLSTLTLMRYFSATFIMLQDRYSEGTHTPLMSCLLAASSILQNPAVRRRCICKFCSVTQTLMQTLSPLGTRLTLTVILGVSKVLSHIQLYTYCLSNHYTPNVSVQACTLLIECKHYILDMGDIGRKAKHWLTSLLQHIIFTLCQLSGK